MQFEFLSLLNSSFFQCHEFMTLLGDFRSFVMYAFCDCTIPTFQHKQKKENNFRKLVLLVLWHNSRKLQNVFFLRPFLCSFPFEMIMRHFFNTRRKFSSFIRLLLRLCIILYDFPRIENEACMQIGPTYVFSLVF